MFDDTYLDRLALEGNETIGYKGGRVAAYDVAGYARVERREAPPQSVAQREIEPSGRLTPAPPLARFSQEAYLLRIGGFRREHRFGPDEIGELIRRHLIPWNDGLGNGLYESLLINRKYGLRQGVEAPELGLRPVYLEGEFEAFREDYRRHVAEMLERYQELQAVYGAPLLRGADHSLAVVHEDSPLGMFVQAWERAPAALQAELESALGFSEPPVSPQNAAERGMLARFWAYVRRKQAQVIAARIDVLRQMVGAGLTVVGNFHELPHLDLEAHGRSYDYPAVAVRPLLIDDEGLLRHYVAYWVQLFKDLAGRAPLVSVRNNLSAVGARFVPGANLNRLWYDQALRHGAGGFYIWPRDYPMDLSNPYDGMMCANPEPRTLPDVRWGANLSACQRLGGGGRFLQPAPQVAILVPHRSNFLDRRGWRRIYAAFSAAMEARVHTGFVSDFQLEQDGAPAQVRLLLIPQLEIVPAGMRAALEGFVANGGALFFAGEDLFDAQHQPAPALAGAQWVDPAIFDLFPLGETASLERLQAAADELRRRIEPLQIDRQAWLFDIGLDSLPEVGASMLRTPDPQIEFRHYLYEHGSNWIYPYIYP